MRFFFLSGFLLSGLFGVKAQHSFIAFYPDTNRPSLTATMDSARQYDGAYTSYYRNGATKDSGRYVHGQKTGYWISRCEDGNKAQEDWHDPAHGNKLVKTLRYEGCGILSDSIVRFFDSIGTIVHQLQFNPNGSLSRHHIYYDPPRKNVVARYNNYRYDYEGYGPPSGDPMSYMKRTSTQYKAGNTVDSIFDAKNILLRIQTGEYSKTFFPNGQIRSYASRDTESTWFDNGQRRFISVRCKTTGAANMGEGPILIVPHHVARYYDRSGILLRENYDYPLYFPAASRLQLTDDKGEVCAEGQSNALGQKQGHWRYFAFDSAGTKYSCEEGYYENGQRTGAWHEWYADKRLKAEKKYRVQPEKRYGQPMYYQFSPRGECDRFVILRNKSRNRKISTNYLVDSLKTWHPSGRAKMIVITDRKGNFDGTWKIFDTAGTVTAQRSYRHGMACDSSFWRDAAGQVFQVVYYDSTGKVKSVKYPGGRKPDEYVPDPFWSVIGHTDGLGKGYLSPKSKGRGEYKAVKQYRKIYQSGPRVGERKRFEAFWFTQ